MSSTPMLLCSPSERNPAGLWFPFSSRDLKPLSHLVVGPKQNLPNERGTVDCGGDAAPGPMKD